MTPALPRRLSKTGALLLGWLLLAACSGAAEPPVTTTAATTTTDATTPSTTPSTTTTTTQPQTALPPLVDQWSGGFGFQVLSADRTAALVVSLTNYLSFFEGRIPEVTVLPDPRWQARVEIGHNLRYWGLGGVPTDASPVVDETWPVVAGTITILEMASNSAGCGPGGLARALFEGFEALTPNGTRVTLGDFEVRNEHWGCVGL